MIGQFEINGKGRGQVGTATALPEEISAGSPVL